MERKNIKIEFRYDGSGYYGFQRQPNKITVQGEIEKILKIVTKEDINLISAGRTDRGVHANHQVSNFYTSSTI
ncbi:MAG: tRNA pseudouridine(38-40) synthase TruA, partial [Fusobacterium periodonticum]|nr:tRNA pseudouridine(38-40) synthase TruA [Fusobacterium periodonticum]